MIKYFHVVSPLGLIHQYTENDISVLRLVLNAGRECHDLAVGIDAHAVTHVAVAGIRCKYGSEEGIKLSRVIEIVIPDQMFICMHVSRKDLIFQGLVGCVNVEEFVLVKEILLFKLVQLMEHCAG